MKMFGLIGKSLKHSFSQTYFTEKFETENINASFQNFELPDIRQFPQVIASNPELKGLSVTIPYKTSIIPYLDELDDVAREINSVNSISIAHGKTKGFNTDIIGFQSSLKPFLKHGMERALILGSGGASKAVVYALRQIGLDTMVVSRNPDQKQLAYGDLNEYAIKTFLLIINTTPLGMYPDVNTYPEIPYQYLTSQHLLYDLTYNPAMTEFLKRGKEKGAATINGLSMLHIQAEASWKIWNSF